MIRLLVLMLIALSLLMGCRKDFTTVERVELDKFMGSWYVIAILPNFMEKNAANGIETYTLLEDGTIGVTYKFRKGGINGKEKLLTPHGKVYNKVSNAEWRMQLLKPFWSPFLIVDLAEDYRYTAIGVPNRKFVWIMSRTPQMSESDYAGVIAKLQQEGYNTSKIVKMPQVW